MRVHTAKAAKYISSHSLMYLGLLRLAPEGTASASQTPMPLNSNSSCPVKMCVFQDLPLRAFVPYL
jgi:hypothetical protein